MVEHFRTDATAASGEERAGAKPESPVRLVQQDLTKLLSQQQKADRSIPRDRDKAPLADRLSWAPGTGARRHPR